ncbi:FAD-dependent monooxygenase [Microbacteriaceae bacterium K1510]|nr:FAD-dependent monooxygenase [Microbacteriaceae bacterium K1510]
MSDPILIAGGGLGGLSAALALGRQGHRVRVLEATPELGAIGYGIQLGPNVFPMFDRLGITQAVLDQSVLPRACIMYDALSGRELTGIPNEPALRQRFGAPYIVIHRVDLHRVLLDACRATDGISLEPSTAVTAYTERDGGVSVTTQDGRSIDGAALVGADGLRSGVRARIVNDGEPKPIGYVAHRTIVPMEEVPAGVDRTVSALWIGPRFHMVHYPLRHNTLFNIVAVFRTDTFGEKGDSAFNTAEVERTYETAHPVMKSLLEKMDLKRRWVIADRDPVRRWSEGRVTILGDAAHPALQTFAQGACMAIEDAVCLGECVAQDSDVTAAFRRYERARTLRTARVQLEGRWLWEGYHAEGIARDVWIDTFSRRSEREVYDCLAWLYEGPRLPQPV